MVDVLRISMTDQLQLKSLLTESCKGTNLYFQYKGLKDTNWTSKSLKIAKSQEEIHDIDPCEKYEVRLATGPESTQQFQELSSIGPFFETLSESDLNKVEFEDGENYYTTSFTYEVSHHNESFVALNFDEVCATKMNIWSRFSTDKQKVTKWKSEGNILSNKKVKITKAHNRLSKITLILCRILSRMEALLSKLNSVPVMSFYLNFI